MLGTSRRIVNNWFNSDANIPLNMLALMSNELNVNLDILFFKSINEVENCLKGYESNSLLSEPELSYKKEKVDFDLIVKKPNELSNLIRSLLKNHDTLMNDPIFKMYVERLNEMK